MKTLLTMPALALAGLAFSLTSAHAAVSYSDGDLILGFHSSASSQDYEIDLGSFTKFNTGGEYATGSPVLIQLQELVPNGFLLDIQSIFGSNPVKFGIAGVQKTSGNGVTSNTMFITKVEETPGTQTSQSRISVGGSSTPAGRLNAQGQQFAIGTDTQNAPANQIQSSRVGNAVIQTISGNNPIAPNNYASFQPGGSNTTGATSYGTFSDAGGNGIEGNFASTGASDVLDLYRLSPGSGAAPLLGIFQFVNGQLLFDSTPEGDTFPLALTAVPEPTTVGVGVSLLALGLASRRRRASLALA